MCYNILDQIIALIERKEAMNKHLDAEKSLETIVYICQKTDNLFNIIKTLYYADKLHLEKYGRLITGDFYVAMEDGPVPSGAYDLIKLVRGDVFSYESKIINAHPESAIKAVRTGKDTKVTSSRLPNLDYLSETDKECLDKAIEIYAKMDGGKLWDLVHREKSYNKTEKNKPIPLSEIISLDIPNGKDVLEYLDS